MKVFLGLGVSKESLTRPTIQSKRRAYRDLEVAEEREEKQGRIHDCSCRGRLGRGSNDLGRGSNNLGRGSNDLGRGSNDLGRGMLKYKFFNP